MLSAEPPNRFRPSWILCVAIFVVVLLAVFFIARMAMRYPAPAPAHPAPAALPAQ